MTNGDKIRQMSNEELAHVISSKCECCVGCWQFKEFCQEGIKAYLDMEVE